MTYIDRLRWTLNRMHSSNNGEWEKYKQWTRRPYDDMDRIQDKEEDNSKHEIDSEEEDDDQEENIVREEREEMNLNFERWIPDCRESHSSEEFNDQ